MGWETRNYGRGESRSDRFRDAMMRILSENPLTWAIPLYTAWGIRVRIHVIFVVLIVSELILTLVQNRLGLPFVAMGMGSLFVLVLLHEYGHCIACRRVGGTADQILMWPLGGLASCSPPHGWKPDLITTLGGPAVNAALWPVLGGAIAALVPPHARWGALVFNPFDPAGAMMNVQLADGTQPYWLYALWWAYYVNAILLLFNMLLPMYPMDGARTLQAILWAKIGFRRATSIVANVGLFVAIILFVFAITGDSGRLVGLAIFGGFMCWMERRRMAMMEGDDPALAGYDFQRGYLGMPDADERPARGESRAEARRRRREQEDQAELDRILAKIARSGMSSLGASEKRWLQRATERRRRA